MRVAGFEPSVAARPTQQPTRSVTCAPRRSPNALTANNMSDALNVVFPRKLLKEFITLYRNLPCLWDKNCVSYKMKHKRHESITKLTQLVQEYDPTATRVHVLRKIESLRACVRREYKRVQDSKKTATTEEEVFTPHLWYYDLFNFMFQAEEMNENDKTKRNTSPQPTIVDSDGEAESIIDDERPFDASIHNYPSLVRVDYSVSNMSDMPDSASTVSKRYLTIDDDKSKRHCTEVEDEYDAIGINVAAKLRHMPENMRILAEKLINDVLYQAQTNGLTNSTAITTPDPFK